MNNASDERAEDGDKAEVSDRESKSKDSDKTRDRKTVKDMVKDFDSDTVNPVKNVAGKRPLSSPEQSHGTPPPQPVDALSPASKEPAKKLSTKSQ